MQQGEKIIVVAGVLFLCSLLMLFDDYFKPIQMAAHTVTEPVMHGARTSSASIADAVSRLASLFSEQDSQRDTAIARLMSENAILRSELDKARRAASLDDGLARIAQITPLPCRITWFDPSAASEVFIIDKGTSDGVKDGMFVCSGSSVAGRIYRAGAFVSIVISVRHSFFRAPVGIEPGGARGIAFGTGAAVEVRFVPTDMSVSAGSEVVTLAEADFTPPSMLIGSVSRATRDESKRLWTVLIEPAIESRLLEDLYIPINFGSAPSMHVPREVR
jgi:rod shape-determining protein MreC